MTFRIVVAALRRCIVVTCVGGVTVCAAGAQEIPPLPDAVTNNAVASGQIRGEWWMFSALGVDATKRWSGITTRATAWRASTGRWARLPDVPGTVGRLASTAQVVRGRLVVVGGYTVDSAGHERSVPAVDIYDPERGTWSRGADMPLAVDDAVSGVYRDSLIYLVSGWHDTHNVQDVQVYDVVQNRWSAATPIPGPGVFGHSGALAGNTIVFVDGALMQDGAVKYRLEPQSWAGNIDPRRPLAIAWRRVRRHPGPPLYRAAAGACGDRILLAGGTDNPYNYSGIGYDSVPSRPRSAVFVFETRRKRWTVAEPLRDASMDHRALGVLPGRVVIAGGMTSGQRVREGITTWAYAGCGR